MWNSIKIQACANLLLKDYMYCFLDVWFHIKIPNPDKQPFQNLPSLHLDWMAFQFQLAFHKDWLTGGDVIALCTSVADFKQYVVNRVITHDMQKKVRISKYLKCRVSHLLIIINYDLLTYAFYLVKIQFTHLFLTYPWRETIAIFYFKLENCNVWYHENINMGPVTEFMGVESQ